jgi:hypothetical protein
MFYTNTRSPVNRFYSFSMFVERLAGGSLGSSADDFVVVEWTAEVGTHWIAPLHIHHADDEARLLEEIHEPGADILAIFARYDSEIVT